MDNIQRGEEAEQLLKNPLLKAAFAGVRDKLIEKLEETPIGDIDTQHEIALMLQTIKTVRKYLENWVRDGQLEANKEATGTAWRKLMKRSGVKL